MPDVSVSHAYKVIREANKELSAKRIIGVIRIQDEVSVKSYE